MMQKQLSLLVFLGFSASLWAQNTMEKYLSAYAKSMGFSMETTKIDEKNGFIQGAMTIDGNMVYADLYLFKTDQKKDIIAAFNYHGPNDGPYTSEVALLGFFDANMKDISGQVFDKKTVEKAYKSNYDQITARGANGDETFYALIPRQKGSTKIDLYIVYGSEIVNGSLPEWTYPVGKLNFNKKTGKFLFIKK